MIDASIDLKEFQGEHFQRVYQYLKRCKNDQALDSFLYLPESVEGTPNECLEILLRYYSDFVSS